MLIHSILVKLWNDRIFQIIEIRKMTKNPKLAEYYRSQHDFSYIPHL